MCTSFLRFIQPCVGMLLDSSCLKGCAAILGYNDRYKSISIEGGSGQPSIYPIKKKKEKHPSIFVVTERINFSMIIV